jgi:hypothetical protein
MHRKSDPVFEPDEPLSDVSSLRSAPKQHTREPRKNAADAASTKPRRSQRSQAEDTEGDIPPFYRRACEILFQETAEEHFTQLDETRSLRARLALKQGPKEKLEQLNDTVTKLLDRLAVSDMMLRKLANHNCRLLAQVQELERNHRRIDEKFICLFNEVYYLVDPKHQETFKKSVRAKGALQFRLTRQQKTLQDGFLDEEDLQVREEYVEDESKGESKENREEEWAEDWEEDWEFG